MADCSRYAVGILGRETSVALVPFASEFDVENIFDLLTELGFTFPPELVGDGNFVNALAAAGDAIRELPELIGNLNASFDQDLVAVLTATGHLLEALLVVFQGLDTTGQALATVAQTLPGLDTQDVADFAAELGDRLLDYIIVSYLEARYPRLLAFLQVLGVATITPERVDSTDPARPPFFHRRVRIDRLATLLTAPHTILEEEYGWGRSDFDDQLLLSRIGALLRAYLVPTEFTEATPTIPASLRVLLFSLKGRHDLSPPGLEANLLLTLNEPFTLKFPFFLEDWFIEIGARGALDEGLSAILSPPGSLRLVPPTGVLDGELSLAIVGERPAGKPAFALLSLLPLGCLLARRVSAGVGVEYHWQGADALGEPILRFRLENAQFSVPASEDDGFLSSISPRDGVALDFDFGIGWSQSRGVFFEGSGGLEATLPIHRTLGPFTVDFLRVGLDLDDGKITFVSGVVGSAALGPVTVIVDSLAFGAELGLSRGNLGPVNLAPKFVPPNGVGIVIDAGAVKGGGFLYFDFDAHRYSGAIELSAFGVAVKAFGLIETRLPDGAPGFSFVIVIVAEFTPIQLGFGFTLVGVGGLIGVNRTVDAKALGEAVRTGSLAHLLFPRNPVADAPAIIHDLATVFPAARGHYLIGPMAKLGWGTPTLITADLGIVLELPGPRIAIVGVVRMKLPSPDAAILSLQLAAAGFLDFPAKSFALDAGLYDSYVAGYALSGDMSYRMGFGDNAKFLLSVGGFNTGFSPPTGFPELRRVSVDLGVNGNPSLTASGYFALTSNSAQIGAKIELKASGYGVRLNGWLGFDVLFVFSPFSFTASISAGMRVSFHGAGIGVTLHGSLSGPTPWHVKGRVCVSVLFWDACLPVDVTFGRSAPAALPELDPWFGSGQVDDPRVQVLGLQEALVNARNWSGSAPPAGFSVVTLAGAATQDRTPIDPLGAATLRQRVAPLNRVLEKFGEYRPVGHDHFNVTTVRLNDVDLNGDGVPDLVPYDVVKDEFAPAHFTELSNAQKLSSDSYEKMDAGFSIAPKVVRTGNAGSQVLEYETAFVTATGDTVRDGPGDARFKLTHEQLLAMLERSASARGGSRNSGLERYKLPRDIPKKVILAAATYVVADACSLTPNSAITPTGTTRSAALLALRAHLRQNPQDSQRFTIAPVRSAA